MKYIKPYPIFESYIETKSMEISPERLAEILTDPDPNVLAAESAAKHPKIPVEALIFASKSKWGAIRSGVASNKKTPISILDELSQDENSDVRFTVARNPSSTADVLVRLSQDEKEFIRETARNNPNFPSDITGWAIDAEDSWL